MPMMTRRISLAVATAAAAVAAVPAVAAATTTPQIAATVKACQPGPGPADRFAVFEGSMPRKAGTARMAMRFDLYLQIPGERATPVDAPSFGRWERSRPNASGFVYDKRVEGLDAPAGYRVRVQYRWYDAKGKVTAKATRRSASCDEPQSVG